MDNNKINEAALTKRLKTLVLQERYEDALKELEDIDIQRLKNNSILCLVGEVYMGLKEYDDADYYAEEAEYYDEGGYSVGNMSTPITETQANASVAKNRKLIKTVDMTIETVSFDETIANLLEMGWTDIFECRISKKTEDTHPEGQIHLTIKIKRNPRQKQELVKKK